LVAIPYDQVVRGLRADAAGQVAVDVRRVPVEQHREPLGVAPGRGDHPGVVVGRHRRPS
jgi:hypothetical protein